MLRAIIPKDFDSPVGRTSRLACSAKFQADPSISFTIFDVLLCLLSRKAGPRIRHSSILLAVHALR